MHAVAVAVKGDAQVGPVAFYQDGHGLRISGAALVIDVPAVGPDPHGDNLGPQFGEDFRGDAVGGAVGAVHHDLEPVQFQFLGEGALQKGNVAAPGVVEAEGLADFGGGGTGALHLGLGHQDLDAGPPTRRGA